MSQATSTERVARDIRRKTRRRLSAEEKLRIVLEGLRGDESLAALCRREGRNPNLYYRWSKEFLEAGKKRLLGDTDDSDLYTREPSSARTGVHRTIVRWPVTDPRQRRAARPALVSGGAADVEPAGLRI